MPPSDALADMSLLTIQPLHSPDTLKQSPKGPLGETRQLNMSSCSLQETLLARTQGVAPDPSKGNGVPIQVIARVRPIIPNELRHPVCIEVLDDSVVNGQKTQIVVRQGIGSTSKDNQKIYSFEKVLDQDTSQQSVFKEVDGRSLCNAFMNGQNCTIFVYGPTSTGKTFTMQGNAEEIIHGQGSTNKAAALSVINQTPDGSVSHASDSFVLQELDNVKPTMHSPGRMKKQSSTKYQASLGAVKMQRGESTGSNALTRKSMGTMRQEDSLELQQIGVATAKPSVAKLAREMMNESRDKGIIQRVLDQIYEGFIQRQDIAANCEVRISFLEIYKEQVTDLLEGHLQKKSLSPKKMKSKEEVLQRGHSSSFALNPSLRPQATLAEQEKDDYSVSNKSPNGNRAKARTFYNDMSAQGLAEKRRASINFELDGSPSAKGDPSPPVRRDGKRSSFMEKRKTYTVKENNIKGVYVQNLTEVVCEDVAQAYNCLLYGLMRKRMSQTCRNTSSSRSHTIFQIKMYMKPQEQNSQLLPQYLIEQISETKLVSKFSLIDLAGSERITEAEKNPDRIDEAKFINKSLSALGNVVAALRTQAKYAGNQGSETVKTTKPANVDSRKQAFQSGLRTPQVGDVTRGSMRRSSVYESRHHVPFRDSKLTHILKDCLGSNSFTHLIICLSPSYLCLAESISTLAFTKNAKAVRQNIVENHQFKADLISRQKGSPEVKAKLALRQSVPRSSLLNQMAGPSEEDEQMLKEVLRAMGGADLNLQGCTMPELFTMTLKCISSMKKDHETMASQIKKMQEAMDKDLSNPKTLEVLTIANSETHSNLNHPHSFTSVTDQTSAKAVNTNVSKQESPTLLLVPKASHRRNLPGRHTQGNARNHSLKAISEEEQSYSIASPSYHSHSNTPQSYITNRKSHELGMHRKQFSTTSVMTFANQNNNTEMVRKLSSAGFGYMDGMLQGKVASAGCQVVLTSRDNRESCESTGKSQDAAALINNYTSVGQPIETEPGEINDEIAPCGCSTLRQYIPAGERSSIIPFNNLEKLQPQSHNTMIAVMAKQMSIILSHRLTASHTPSRYFIGTRRSHDRANETDHIGYISSIAGPESHAAGSARGIVENSLALRDLLSPERPKKRDSLDSLQMRGQVQAQNNHFTQLQRTEADHRKNPSQDSLTEGFKIRVKHMKSSSVDEPSREMDHLNHGAAQQNPERSRITKNTDFYSSQSSSSYPTREQQDGQPLTKQQQFFESSRRLHNLPKSKLQKYKPQDNGSLSMKDLKKMNKRIAAQSAAAKAEQPPSYFQPKFDNSHAQSPFENSRLSYGASSAAPVTSQSLAQSQSQKFIASMQACNPNNKLLQYRSGLGHSLSKKTITGRDRGESERAAKSRGNNRSIASSGGLVVEEVNEISSEAFLRIRENQNQFVNSLHESSLSSSKVMEPLGEDDRLQKPGGSLMEPQSLRMSSIKPGSASSMQYGQYDQNGSFFSQTNTVQFSQLAKNSSARRHEESATKPQKKQGQRQIQKTLISDLNKVHQSKPSGLLSPYHEMSGKKRGETKKRQSLEATQTQPIPLQLTHTRKPQLSFHSNGSRPSLGRLAFPATTPSNEKEKPLSAYQRLSRHAKPPSANTALQNMPGNTDESKVSTPATSSLFTLSPAKPGSLRLNAGPRGPKKPTTAIKVQKPLSGTPFPNPD